MCSVGICRMWRVILVQVWITVFSPPPQYVCICTTSWCINRVNTRKPALARISTCTLPRFQLCCQLFWALSQSFNLWRLGSCHCWVCLWELWAACLLLLSTLLHCLSLLLATTRGRIVSPACLQKSPVCGHLVNKGNICTVLPGWETALQNKDPSLLWRYDHLLCWRECRAVFHLYVLQCYCKLLQFPEVLVTVYFCLMWRVILVCDDSLKV